MVGRFISLAFGVIGLGGIESAYGQGLITQCNSCTSADYYSLASSLGKGHHLIGDFTKDVLVGYNVTRESNGRDGYFYNVDTEGATSETLSGFEDYRKLIVDYHSSEVIVIVPTPRPSGYPAAVDGISAVEWAGTPNFKNFMSIWFANLQTQSVPTSWLPGAAAMALLAMQSGVTVNGYAPSIVFKIQTTAGATVTLVWKDDAKTIVQSVIDSYGNSVPIMQFDGPTNFGGKYEFSDKNPIYSRSLLDYLNRLGAKIDVNPSQFPIWSICVGGKCDVLPN